MTYYKSLLYFFSVMFLLVSCSSDDGNEPEVEVPPVVGVWNLTGVNLNIAQDPNEDGTASTNMVDELPCLTGVINIDASGAWTATITAVNISPVTGDFYVVSCLESQQLSGVFSYQNGQLNLNNRSFSNFTLSGTTLTENIGENLPGIRSKTYEKQ